MVNNEIREKKSNTGLIITLVVIGLALIIAIALLLRGGSSNEGNGGNNTPTPTEKGDENTLGVLYQVSDDNNSSQNEFIIDGLILVGNMHNYFEGESSSKAIENFVKEGYKKSDINASFYLNEHISFYMDTKFDGNDMDVKIFVVPDHTIEEYKTMSYDDINNLAVEKGTIMDYVKPNQKNHKYVNELYVKGTYPTGKYDILITYKYKLAYYMNIEIVEEEVY